MNQQNEITIRPYTHKQLAALYGICWLTFQHWLKPHAVKIGRKQGHFYNSKQVGIIFQTFGWPESTQCSLD
jgi:hypothetical protein